MRHAFLLFILPAILFITAVSSEWIWARGLYAFMGYGIALYWTIAYVGLVLSSPEEVWSWYSEDAQLTHSIWLSLAILGASTLLLDWWWSALAYLLAATLAALFVRTSRIKLNMARRNKNEKTKVVIPKHKMN